MSIDTVNRGVSIKFLLEFTKKHNCWDWQTRRVRNEIILPATHSQHCRYVELDSMQNKNIVGKAVTFVSHTWGGKWGDLVAAVCENADPSRFVWVDIFAIRQWPSTFPDLDFRGTIRLCSSFLIVCSSLEELIKVRFNRDPIASLSKNVRNQIAFLRVWCLVEVHAAATHSNMIILMKAGSYKRNVGGQLSFTPNSRMLLILKDLIDVRKAEATVASDKEMILAEIITEDFTFDIFNQRIADIIEDALFNLPLLKNAACGDADALKQVIKKPNDVISLTARFGYLDILNELLLNGVGIDAVDVEGETALTNASYKGNVMIVRILLDNGADIGIEAGNYDLTATMRASSRGHVEVERLLLDRGVNVNAVNKHGYSALLMASSTGHTAVVCLLLDRGADVNAIDMNGDTALLVASSSGRTDTVRILLDRGANVNVFDWNRDTALTLASRFGGSTEVVRLLLDGGADLYAVNKDRYNALFLASHFGHADIACLLLDRGADLNAVNKNGYNPLFLASEHGHTDVMSLLLDRGADVNAVKKYGETALLVASSAGSIEVVSLLLDRGANANAADMNGGTALLWASSGFGSTDVVRLLLDKGADVNAVDNFGNTAFRYAKKNGHDEIVKLLRKRGARGPTFGYCVIN